MLAGRHSYITEPCVFSLMTVISLQFTLINLKLHSYTETVSYQGTCIYYVPRLVQASPSILMELFPQFLTQLINISAHGDIQDL